MGFLFVAMGGVLAVAIMFPLLDAAAVGARFYIRRSRKASYGKDDWTILGALGLICILSAILIAGVVLSSFGTHTETDPVTGEVIVTDRDQHSVMLEWAYTMVLIPTLGTIKLSVMFFFRRIFVGTYFSRWYFAVCIFIGLWTIAFFFSTLFSCGTHPAAFWTSFEEIAEFCDNDGAESVVYRVLDVVTDLLVLVTPLPLIWNLQMARAQKIAISGIFMLGLFSTAAALARLVWYILGPYESTDDARDLIAVETLTVAWGQIEVGVAIFAACLPALRPLFQGNSPESLIGRIRSKLSFGSLFSGKQELSDVEDCSLVQEKMGAKELLRTDLGSSGPPSRTEISGQRNDAFKTPSQGITKHSELSFLEEKV